MSETEFTRKHLGTCPEPSEHVKRATELWEGYYRQMERYDIAVCLEENPAFEPDGRNVPWSAQGRRKMTRFCHITRKRIKAQLNVEGVSAEDNTMGKHRAQNTHRIEINRGTYGFRREV